MICVHGPSRIIIIDVSYYIHIIYKIPTRFVYYIPIIILGRYYIISMTSNHSHHTISIYACIVYLYIMYYIKNYFGF